MPFAMGPAFQPGSGVANPPMLNRTANTASAILKGSILLYSSNLLVVAATNPTAGTIVGVSSQDNNTAPGYNMGNQPTVVTNRRNEIAFYPANITTMFASHIVNNSNTYVTPALTDVGAKFGFYLRSDGEWALDRNVTATTALAYVRDIDIDAQLVFWQFLATAILA